MPIVAILLLLLSRSFASADCSLSAATDSRWKLDSQNGVHWLLTPCGERFFSIGINCLYEHSSKPPYARLPLNRSSDAWRHRAVERMAAWNFNTVGGFSSADWTLPAVPELDLGWKARFHWDDPFEPATEESMLAEAREAVTSYKGSPYRIGYFSDNEVGWWNGALFVHFIRKPGTNFTKQRLVALIRDHYGNDWHRFIEDFVVSPEISSFRDLLQSEGALARLRPGGNGIRVVRRWTAIIAGHYYKFVHRALHEADPEALIFGDRLPIYYDPDAVRAMAPFVDAIATNYNVDSPDGWISHYYFDGLRRLTGNKPVLISEWFFASRQNRSGNLNNGHLMTVQTQTDRARGAVNAARRFALDPNIVGIHWFEYRDDPKGGRADGEDYNFGLVDTADRPYQELTAALSVTNRTLAEIHRTATPQPLARSTTGIEIPEADIDARDRSLADWPKDEALVKDLVAPSPEVVFGDMFLAWSPKGLHLATVSMDYYSPYLLAFEGKFPLEEAFRIDLGVDAGAGPRRFALFVIPPKVFPKKGAPAMRIGVCLMNRGACEPVSSATATYFGSDQPRITAEITLPWTALGTSGPPNNRRLRLQLAATAFHRSRWMSLSGAPPEKAMKDSAGWRVARLKSHSGGAAN